MSFDWPAQRKNSRLHFSNVRWGSLLISALSGLPTINDALQVSIFFAMFPAFTNAVSWISATLVHNNWNQLSCGGLIWGADAICLIKSLSARKIVANDKMDLIPFKPILSQQVAPPISWWSPFVSLIRSVCWALHCDLNSCLFVCELTRFICFEIE